MNLCFNQLVCDGRSKAWPDIYNAAEMWSKEVCAQSAYEYKCRIKWVELNATTCKLFRRLRVFAARRRTFGSPSYRVFFGLLKLPYSAGRWKHNWLPFTVNYWPTIIASYQMSGVPICVILPFTCVLRQKPIADTDDCALICCVLNFRTIEGIHGQTM